MKGAGEIWNRFISVITVQTYHKIERRKSTVYPILIANHLNEYKPLCSNPFRWDTDAFVESNNSIWVYSKNNTKKTTGEQGEWIWILLKLD